MATLVGCSQSSGPSLEPVGSAGDLRAALAAPEGNYRTFETPGELGREVDVVVRGTITGIAEGRSIVYDPENYPEESQSHMVVSVRVDDIVRGQQAAGETSEVYVEVPTSVDVDTDALADAAPRDVLLFLDEVDPRSGGAGTRVSDVDAGRPVDSRLYAPWPAGFLYLDGDQVEDLRIDVIELGPGWSEHRSLDSLERAAASG
ncbi:MAG: hypothetical protein WD010_01755 [Nitriliruptor sp.]|uniref:hypothetical protein n=1 Tax=Nitriliruptor sp. TaxID=2448056 RepID=UPI0034A09206